MIFKVSDNIISSLGFSSGENFESMLQGITGIKPVENPFGIPENAYLARVSDERLEIEFRQTDLTGDFTRFEKLVITSACKALKNAPVNPAGADTLFILATTKGNIDLLESPVRNQTDQNRLCLWDTANRLAHYFGNKNRPVVVSNACISGVSAILTAKLAIASGKYKHAVVTGADIISKFTLSGFLSFKALSTTRCRPFDISRDGLSLGEGAGTIVLSAAKELSDSKIAFIAGTSSNDANHISGPSRTGEGLYQSVVQTINEVEPVTPSFINAHGTATLYNDEMEAIAFQRAGLNHIPLNSLKGYIGHTLGAAGIIESIICALSLEKGTVPGSLGYSGHGVSVPLNVIPENLTMKMNSCLKTASGFGGCNASLFIQSLA